jgi:uncharacterized protein YegL
MSNNAVDINSLLGAAKQEGSISNASANVLTAVDIGDRIREGLGIGVDDVQASDVILVTLLIDDSGSIRMAGNAQPVRDGHNELLKALKASKQESNMLVHTCYLNGTVLFPYRLIGSSEDMTASNYNPNQGTPLYEATIVTLGRVLAKAQEFSDNGVPVRTVTLIMTDGASTDYHRTADEVKTVVRDMMKKETHIVAGMGVQYDNTDFRQVFREMGIPDEWILTAGSSASEIRKAFQVFSRSAVRASQNAATFSSTLGGGFDSSNVVLPGDSSNGGFEIP